MISVRKFSVVQLVYSLQVVSNVVFETPGACVAGLMKADMRAWMANVRVNVMTERLLSVVSVGGNVVFKGSFLLISCLVAVL